MTLSFVHRWRALAAASVLGLALAGCGGGSDGVGSGGTGTFSSGTITGFGSIIVNGVRYDDSAAQVIDAGGRARSTSDLRLGMVVEIEASEIRTDPVSGRRTASASSIRYGSEIEGPVEALDATTGQLVVLGQTVITDAATVYDDDLRGGLAAVRVGDVLEVNGYFTGDGRYGATRIDREDDDDGYELRGPVSAVDAAARTLTIGTATSDYAAIAAPPAVAVGDFIRVNLARAKNAAGQWVATRLSTSSVGGDGGSGQRADRSEAELEGYITAFASAASFSVNGVPVDASGVASLPPGLAAGVRVEVEGRFEAGRLIARKVEIERDDQTDDGLEIEGLVGGLDAAARTFAIRGVAIVWNDSTRFERGVATQLRDGARVDVHGILAADGVTVLAQRIEFEN